MDKLCYYQGVSTITLSHRGVTAPASPIRKLIPFADSAKAQGVKVYHLNIGDPDFEAPEEIRHTLQTIAKDLVRIPYANSKGDKDMIASWITYFSQLGISLSSEHIVVTSGGSEGLILASSVIMDSGDEFLVFEPYYANYKAFANLLGIGISAVALDSANGYHLPSDKDIENALTSKTKAIFFTNPNNPTGTVFDRKEIERVLAIAQKHNLFVVSDETYRGMTFDGKESLSVIHVATEEQKKQIIIVDSLSKRLNVCGARIGAVISYNTDVIDAVYRTAQARLSVALIEQQMVTPMLTHALPYVAQLAKQYEGRRNAFITALEKELGTTIHRPEGAFYLMLSLPVDDTEKFAKWLLTDFRDAHETVMVAPGAGFYATPGKGKNEIRVAYVLNEKDLIRSAELLGKAVKVYSQK